MHVRISSGLADTLNDFSSPARILIVETDAAAAEPLAAELVRLGHTVCATVTLQPPVSLPEDVRPDLVLAGLGTDRIAAIEIAQQVAARCGAPPIVYVTAPLDASLLEQAQRTAPYGYVLKPVDARQLDLTIAAARHTAARVHALEAKIAADDPGGAESGILKSLIESMSDAVIATDAQGNFRVVNAAVFQLNSTMRDVDPIRWTDRYDVLQSDGQTPFPLDDLPLERGRRGEATDDVLMLLRPRDPSAGEAVWLSASGRPVLDEAKRLIGSVVVLRNVTDEREREATGKRVHAELHERVQVLDAVIQSMSDGVVVANAGGQLTLFNPSAKRLVGIGLTDSTSQEWAAVYGLFLLDGKTPVPADNLPLVRAMRGETVAEQELFVRNQELPDGGYISVNASPGSRPAGAGQRRRGGVPGRDTAQTRRGGPARGVRPGAPGSHRHGAAQHRQRDQQRRGGHEHVACLVPGHAPGEPVQRAGERDREAR